MKKLFLRVGEVLCVVLLAVFIFVASSQEKLSSQPFEAVSEGALSLCDTKGLLKQDSLKLKKQFSVDGEMLRDFVYYASDSVMDVREVLIIALEDISLQETVAESIKAYITEKQKLFEGYAPKESQLLSSHVLIADSGYILLYVGENSELISQAFKESI